LTVVSTPDARLASVKPKHVARVGRRALEREVAEQLIASTAQRLP